MGKPCGNRGPAGGAAGHLHHPGGRLRRVHRPGRDRRGYRARVVDYDLGAVAGSSLRADGYEGQARMVVDEKRAVLLDATLVGQDVGELIHAATVAVMGVRIAAAAISALPLA